MESQLVIFILGDEHYGVDIDAVAEIIKLQSITTVPHAPRFVEGVTNLRGSVLPVIDLRKRFGLPIQEFTKNARIVVVEMEHDGDCRGTKVGMIVDAVSEVLYVSEGDIESPSPIIITADSTFITGIAKVDERLIILLELGEVLSPKEKADLEVLRQAQDEALQQAQDEAL